MPYQRVTMEELEEQYKKIKEAFQNANSAEEQFAVHKQWYQLSGNYITAKRLANIRHDGNMIDEFYDKENAYYDEIEPKLKDFAIDHKKDLYHSKFRDELEKEIGSIAFCNMELSMRSFTKELIPLLQEENAFVSKYSKLYASAAIDWDGEILNLSMLRKYQVDKDREVRRRACREGAKFFEDHAEEFDSIYDSLVKNRTRQAKLLGYDNYLPLGYDKMQRNCYGRAEVEQFRKQVKEILVPLASKIHNRRRERLQLDRLAFCDEAMNFKDGNPAPVGTPEEILLSGQKMYSELSPETKEFFDFMQEYELFDVFGRKNKKNGGYMTYLPNYKAPFIYANFNGTAGDVDVITHECGHAFQGFVQRKEEVREKTNISMETAEVHSMSMEFFTEPWMELFFKDRTKEYIQMHLEEAITFIPYGCMVDEFQHIVYENPDMKPAERHAAWSKLEKIYKPHLDYEGDPFYGKGGYWQRQHHIYTMPFYYIDYCLAQTCALQFKVKIDEDYQDAWKKYLEFCKLGASGFFTDMIPTIGLTLPFEEGCLKHLAEKLEEKLQFQ